MRHRVFGKKLNRDVKERKALFKNLIVALIVLGRVRTTLAKAKAISSLVEKLVTKAKDGGDSALRQVTSFLAKKEAVHKLTKEIAPRFVGKIGGYLRMVRIGRRKGDSAQKVVLEWSIKEEKEKKIEKKDKAKPEE